MASITLKGVSKAYGKHEAVIRNVDLNIAQGEFCVFVGASGCGKSTLLRMIAGLEDIGSGELFIGDRKMNEVPAAQRGVAMVFQSYALFPHMTVYENMAFGLTLAKVDKAVVREKVVSAARILQLEHLLARLPKALSGGQRQRVAIGRAIVREPGVFLFDEPLSNLDAVLRVQTRYEIAKIHREIGRASTVYVTHDQVEAMTLADRIVLLNSGSAVAQAGSIAQCGAPLELYHRPRNLFVAGFIGSPKMNFIPARLIAASERLAQVILATGEILEAQVDARRVPIGAPVTLGIRPEDASAGNGSQHLIREVQWQERLGDATYLYLRSGEEHAPWIVKVPGNTHADPGQRVPMAVPSSALHVFDAEGDALPRCVDASDILLPLAA
ncbi:sn-glycerol-3-phosphate ABC transporter ATP-binding protein UgpC [Collimonas sp.]|jgi:multiple sugar transport system ATP-binding protein|uniref:ABC transporter ATP-binding protein n=1 Tax=Collimonas sp. TaxID=1963772 RepID=UPI002CA5C049|nr:sn-glycerol-3-phosphate ABC transporter ATP-binding protein UgpC [Collimonas sp.]HWW06840.1 sn-glycerol-3-phosphate ABC transporter ATP-binding protein UgpC [Collimonas sp.]